MRNKIRDSAVLYLRLEVHEVIRPLMGSLGTPRTELLATSVQDRITGWRQGCVGFERTSTPLEVVTLQLFMLAEGDYESMARWDAKMRALECGQK